MKTICFYAKHVSKRKISKARRILWWGVQTDAPKPTPPMYKLAQTKVYLVKLIKFYEKRVSKRKITNDKKTLLWGSRQTPQYTS